MINQTEQSIISPNEAVLRITILRNGRIEEFAELFSVLDKLYKHMIVLDIISREAERKSRVKNDQKFSSIPVVKILESQVKTSERLKLYRIKINSPGYLDVLGQLKILENLRGFINERHERKKDNEYRNDSERKRLELENAAKEIENSRNKTALIEQQMQLLSSYGVPESKIRDALMSHLEKPIDAINHQSEIGLIGESELINPSETDEKP